MRKISSPDIISKFFGNDVELFELNIIIVLYFLLQQKSHKKIVENILLITSPGVPFSRFKKIVEEHKKVLESHSDTNKKLLGTKIETSGDALIKLKFSPTRWLFIALYWSFNFRDNSLKDINRIYNDKIGNIALIFILKKNQMHIKETRKGLSPRPLTFYTDHLLPPVVKSLEILTKISVQDNKYLNSIYLSENIPDIVENFFMTISSNRLESNTLSIVTIKKKPVIRYQNIHYGIVLFTPSTRILRDGFMSEPEATHRRWLQLINLEPKNAGNNNPGKRTEKRRQKHIYDEIDSALIPVTMIDPSIINVEEETERKNKIISTRSIYSNKQQKNISSSLMQHRQNKTFSSTVTKNYILQESDYDVPPIPILTLYCQRLNETTLTDKFFKSLFLISACVGSRTEDIVNFIAGEKQSIFKLKDTTLSTHIETDFFAKKRLSDLFVNTGTTFSFGLPTRLAMLLSESKKNYQTIATNQFCLWFHSFSFSQIKPKDLFSLKKSSIQFLTPKERLLTNYIKYLSGHTKEFEYRITIKPTKTYRYLFHYINIIGGDIRTAKLATATHSQNDRSKLAYTSSRTNATHHAQYPKQFWLVLDLDRTSDSLLSIPISTYKTSISELSNAQYSGSALVVKANVSQIFFKSLLTNIEDCTNDINKFNLISIYVRYALSLLAGTREFSNSGNFKSWSKRQKMLSVNEKSLSLSMGIRYIPINRTLSNILTFYQNILQEKGLPDNVYLYHDNAYSAYSARNAVLIIEDMPNLVNKEMIRQYTLDVPLNAGRHIFTCKALDLDIQQVYIDAYLGHYGKGEEQLGTYSCLNLRNFVEHTLTITSSIEIEHGIKELK